MLPAARGKMGSASVPLPVTSPRASSCPPNVAMTVPVAVVPVSGAVPAALAVTVICLSKVGLPGSTLMAIPPGNRGDVPGATTLTVSGSALSLAIVSVAVPGFNPVTENVPSVLLGFVIGPTETTEESDEVTAGVAAVMTAHTVAVPPVTRNAGETTM